MLGEAALILRLNAFFYGGPCYTNEQSYSTGLV